MEKIAALLERAEWAERPDAWKGEFEGKLFGTDVSVMFYTTDEVGRGPRLHRHPYDEVFIIRRETAEAFASGVATKPPEPKAAGQAAAGGAVARGDDGGQPQPTAPVTPPPDPADQRVARIVWEGDVPPQKWMNFYTKVLARFATKGGLSVSLQVFVEPPAGVSQQQIDELRSSLRDLGLNDHVEIAKTDQCP